MIKSTRRILADILKRNVSQALNDALLRLMAYSGELDKISSNDIFDSDKEHQLYIPGENHEYPFHDYRLKWISFKNFRSVPDSGSAKPYGLSFQDDEGKPQSVFLVGKNGSGKTTVYSAFEHHYLSDNSLSKEMKLDRQKILTYGFEELAGVNHDNVELTVEMVEQQTVDDMKDRESYCSPAPFCSEYDLIQLGSQGGDLTDYVLEQLGYGELGELKNVLTRLVKEKNSDIKDSTSKKASDLDVNDLDDIIRQLLKYRLGVKNIQTGSREYKSLYATDKVRHQQGGAKPIYFQNYWQRLKNLHPRASMEPVAILGDKARERQEQTEQISMLEEKLKNMYEELEKGLRLCRDNTEEGVMKALEELYQKRYDSDKQSVKILSAVEQEKAKAEKEILDLLIREIANEEGRVIDVFKTERFGMIKNILHVFSNNDAELFIQEPTGGQEHEPLVIKIRAQQSDGTTFTATPQEYFNSFRYKLYAVSFKIALALMEMKQKNIRVPIVIDDVFNASDFENSIRLEYFVHNIYEAYASMEFEQPLQLILLTHDDMVQTAFRKGTNIVVDGGNRIHKVVPKMPNYFCCGRLFNWRYVERFEKSNLENTAPNTSRQEQGFMNLYITN